MSIITLTSDFGQKDYLVGAVKGQLLRINPEFNLIDISHELAPFNYMQVAYTCRNSIWNFPDQSFHLLLVNLFEVKPRQLLFIYHREQYLLCADNGLISMIIDEKPELVISLPLEENAVKNTLYCASLMGKAVNRLLNGESLEKIGIPEPEYLEKTLIKPILDTNWMEGHILFIDNFENVVIDITREQFEERRQGRKFQIAFKRDEIIDQISETYAEVAEGEKLALFNSAGYLEIAINKGNAAGLFGLQGFNEQSANEQNRLLYQTVRIHFT